METERWSDYCTTHWFEFCSNRVWHYRTTLRRLSVSNRGFFPPHNEGCRRIKGRASFVVWAVCRSFGGIVSLIGARLTDPVSMGGVLRQRETSEDFYLVFGRSGNIISAAGLARSNGASPHVFQYLRIPLFPSATEHFGRASSQP